MRQATTAGMLVLLMICSAPCWSEAARVGVGSIAAGASRGGVSVSGELSAVRTAVISAEVAGAVAGISAETGDTVSGDAVLAVLRDAPARLAWRAARGRVAEAEADVERARINERRFGRLLQRKALSQDEYDTARVELDKALAVLETRSAEAERLADDLARHQLRAPFAGTIVRRDIELGQWLDAGDPCFIVEDTSVLRAKLSVPQRYYDAISTGAEARIHFDALPGQGWSGKVARKPPLVRSAGRSFEVWLDIDNPAGRLVPGLSVQARLALDAVQGDQLEVPRDAVMRNQAGVVWVWLVEGEGEREGEREGAATRVRRVEVEVEGSTRSGTLIRGEGLAPGQVVVTRGNEALQEGQSVSIVGDQ